MGVIRKIRKISEKNGREVRGILMKKGCKMGGVSL
nr:MULTISPECIES: glycosyltransferase [Capnocytophaga]